eukprot:GFUD01113341.1.p1 GENE.GFUD01113341.1~~GFUD01113341.1.p1  ORF type:complete len:253 (-),score=63.88 GFUD01113341.1:84-842(-)
MLSLRNLCLLKVSSLKLSYEEGEVPKTLANDLKKMILFNGSFFGHEEYVYNYNVYNENDIVERQAVEDHVLTIQYQGDGIWAFGICHKFDPCTGRICDGNGHCGKKPERLQFVLEENKTCESEAVFSIVRGFSKFRAGWLVDLMREKNRDKQQVSTVLTVENGKVPDSVQLMLTTSAVLKTGQVIRCKIWVNSTLESSPVFQYSVTVGVQSREINLFLTESQVTAKEAFPEAITECEFIDGDWTDDEEEADD